MYIPNGNFATKAQMRMLLAECPTAQQVLEVPDAPGAIAKIATTGARMLFDDEGNIVAPTFDYPRALIMDEAQSWETTQGSLTQIMERRVSIWLAFYVPADVDGIDDASDEETWVVDQFSAINDELRDRMGTGEPIPGKTHLTLKDPTFYGVDPEADDERGDPAVDPHPELPRWFGLLEYMVN
ncbi:MAG: hypothetical protein AAFX06_21790 [Planctomycetota bacterium]